MPLDSLLLEILADPNDKQPLLWFETDGLLYNPRRKEAYTVADGIPVLLPSEARTLTEAEHEVIEMWAAHCFQTLLFNLVAPTQNISLYEEFGLDPNRVIEEMGKLVNDETRREEMKEATNIFRVLVKTLVNAGIITDRTKGFYNMYVDIDELKGEGDKMVGDDIAEEGIKYLQQINFKDRALAKILIAAE